MRIRFTLLIVAVVQLLCCAQALADPGSGPRETVDQSFTATAPGTPTGLGFSSRFHAAGDPTGNPPYLHRMVFTPPPGFRYDTSVPGRCSAPDLQLELQGPAACPANSRLGTGTTSGIFWVPITHSFVFDRFQHHLDVMNNANEQILLVQSEGWTVVRGKFEPDGSLVFDTPACFPAPPTGCLDDYITQLGSSTVIPAYTKGSRSYATTPPTCPSSGHWTTTVTLSWSDGSKDAVQTTEPCSAATSSRAPRRRPSHRGG